MRYLEHRKEFRDIGIYIVFVILVIYFSYPVYTHTFTVIDLIFDILIVYIIVAIVVTFVEGY